MSDPAAAPSAPRPIDPAAVAHALRRLARAEAPPWLHTEVARRMAERLSIIKLQPQALVDWWGFGGAGAELLAKAYPQARRIVVEPTEVLAQRSVQQAQAPWWSPWRRSTVEVMAARDLAPASAQLVWANMMLHAALDPAALMVLWQRALAVDGFVMFSSLGPGSLRQLRELYRRLGWPPAMAEFVDMHDLGDMLVQAGFADPVMDQELLTLTWASPEALLAELRTWGGNASPARCPGLRTPRWRDRLIEALQATVGPDGRIVMQVEVAYGHAFKPLPRAPLQAETTVSLDDMRQLVRSRPARM